MLACTVGTAAAERVLGTPGGDTIRGTREADRLFGHGGDDRIFGLAGDDLLSGGRHADRLWGGSGRDRLLARDGASDVVVCGPGRDVAVVDRLDLVQGCETVQRPPVVSEAPPPPSPPPAPPPVVLENRKPGTHAWASFDLAPRGAIEGYAAPSAAAGETLAFHVSTRRREIGVRIALGADARRLVVMVMRQSFVVVIVGAMIGVPLSLAAARALGALLFEIPPWHPAPVLTGVLVLVAVGALASLLPSRNAARVDPVVAMRAE